MSDESKTKSKRGGFRPGAGRKAFHPTLDQRLDVQGFKAEGWTEERLARLVGISLSGLRRHFKDELDCGADREQLRLRQQLRDQADKGSVQAIRELLRRAEVGGGIDRFLAQPEKLPAVQPDVPVAAGKAPKLGKKEIALEEARTAHLGEWGEDLAPIPERMN